MAIIYSGTQTNTSPPQWMEIDYFYVANIGTQVQVNSSSPSPVPEVEGKATGSGVPVRAIVGGVVGGIFGLIALAGLAWFVMRKWESRSRNSVSSDNGHSDMADRWTSEPLPDSRIKGIGAGEGVPVDAGLANFVDMKRAQREVVNEQAGYEQDSGLRYGTSPLPGAATRLPPIYTPE
ncbi:hypothetical protein PM082_024483 [Marasmius tenuissimus]|nr:hypothetical protein PM082_024483 [Marasmius tenuissimus]